MRLMSIGIALVLTIVFARTDDPDAASLGGRITDNNLAAIPSATISVRNVFSADNDYTKSDWAGSFKFNGMRQGRYSVFATAEGYGCTSVFNVFLFRGKRTQLDL